MSFYTVTDSPLWLTAGWTMLHFLWIGAIVGMFAWVGRKMLTTASPTVRYLFALCCLTGLAVAPGLIAIQVYVPAFQEEIFETGSAAVSTVAVPVPAEIEAVTESEPIAAITPISTPVIPERNLFTQQLNSAVVWLPWVWFLGAPTVFALLATGIIGADRLRKQSRLLDEGPVADACRELTKSLKIARRVTIGVCDRLKTPILIGVIRPMILLPPAALAGWSPDQLEMVLLHELIHLRRWDNLVNLSQRVIESVLFFHPVVWWVSRWIRLEREHCCDTIVVLTTGRPQEYAETLAALSHATAPRLHAGVAMAEHNTVTRIRRILNLEDPTMRLSRTALLLTSLLLITPAVLFSGYVAYGDSAETGSTSPDKHKQMSESDSLAAATDQTKKAAGIRKLLITSKRTGNFEIFLMNEDGSDAQNLTNHDAEDGAPDWSPDGKKIVFASNRAYKHNIFVMDADGSNVKRLTHDGEDFEPAWSPDGKKIMFRRKAEGQPRQIFVMNADGSNKINLCNNASKESDAAWSPDGKKIAFGSNRDTNGWPYYLYLMDTDGSNVQRVSPRKTSYLNPTWSPDGKKIAYTGFPDNFRRLPSPYEIYVFDFKTGTDTQLTTMGGLNTYMAWSSDGKKVVFTHYEKRGAEQGDLYIMDADGSNQQEFLPAEAFLGDGGSQPAWKP